MMKKLLHSRECKEYNIKSLQFNRIIINHVFLLTFLYNMTIIILKSETRLLSSNSKN